MTEQNLFQPIDTLLLYSDNIGKVTLYDASFSNESEEQRIWTVTTIASLAYGNEEAKNPEALYERMKSIKHESLWEFIVDIYSANGIPNSMRNLPSYYDTRYSNLQDVLDHKKYIACFRIKVPIFVARQFMRHRSFSYLEMSRRYTKDSKKPFQYWSPQGMHGSKIEFNANQLYEELVAAGYHTQIASRFLPQTTYTEFYCMGEVEGLRNFFTLRCSQHAQEEIREVAEAMLKLLEAHQPELHTKVLP
jgi:hypothetical protein